MYTKYSVNSYKEEEKNMILYLNKENMQAQTPRKSSMMARLFLETPKLSSQ